MASRKNPQRSCQEGMLPMNTAYKAELAITEFRDDSYNKSERQPPSQRRTKRKATDTQMRTAKLASQQPQRPTSDKPFPFFELPREIRDQVYSCLVTRPSGGRSLIAAMPILNSRKKRVTAHAKRGRVNRRRIFDGKQPLRTRETHVEPVVNLKFLQSSHRLHQEAKDCLYSSNWFAITLDRLPHTTFETPYGWDLSRVTRLQVELQLKDAAHMNSYVDWSTLFSPFTSLRFLHVVFTFHPRYYDWAYSELCDWSKTQYVHKAFFRELLVAIPGHVDVKLGTPNSLVDSQLQGKVVSEILVRDMYAELGAMRTLHPRNPAGHSAISWR
jgi:hypothetical protein